MLVLSRRPNESIAIGDGIVITIVSVRGSNVRIGIEAPRDVNVRRTELEVLDAKIPANAPGGGSHGKQND